MYPQSTYSVRLAVLVAALLGGAMRADAERPPPSGDQELVGTFEISFYWVTRESDFDGARTTSLYDAQCREISRVPKQFAKQLRLEGTGQLADGRLVNTAGSCDCGTSPCYFEVPAKRKWGVGVKNRPLSPFRSIAVDHRVVPIGTRLYIPELDGVRVPGKSPWGGFVHDGCVIADDRGGGVDGHEIDLFAGFRPYYRVLQKTHRFEHVTAYDGGERCESLGEGKHRHW